MILSGWGVAVGAYPPDNAAVLYYKAFMVMPKNTVEVMDKISLADINEPNETLKAFLKENGPAIKLIEDASKVEQCDWGDDYSQGFELLVPYLVPVKTGMQLAFLKARTQFWQKDYDGTIETLLNNYRMASHVADGTDVCYMLGSAIEGRTSVLIGEYLGKISANEAQLNRIKFELSELEKRHISQEIILERYIVSINFSSKGLGKQIVSGLVDDTLSKKILEQIKNGDEQFWADNEKYFLERGAEAKSAMQFPYERAIPALQAINNQIKEDANSNPNAMITHILWPAVDKLLNVRVRDRNRVNALRAAVEIYLSKCKAGNLPMSLPAGLPVDLYSGKEFGYEVKAGGFVLRARGKDLINNEIPVYEFKVK